MSTRAPSGTGSGAAASLPWWLSDGDEECAACGHAYAYEVEVRCIDCDAAMCPVCVAWVTRQSFCPGCIPGGT